jgi:NapC/NirT cytochrome c family, N-terminal region
METPVAAPNRPRLAQNPITGMGIFIATVSAALFLLFFVIDLLGLHANPYLGIVFFLVLPSLFVLGLLLIPVGAMRERRRRLHGLPPTQWRWPRLDLNDPGARRIAAGVAVLTIVNVVIVGLAAYKGIEYMDSVSFCGRVCHTVMEPEFTAYQDGPHARVKCVECHIGPGAPWFVKSKVDGIRQVWAVTFNSYERPIPTPVHSLRPARETCEQCHWPEKFTGDLVKTIPAYGDDEANTPGPTVMQMRVGGGGWRFGGPHGIHWHTSADHKVEYIAADDHRESIPYVRLKDAGGRITEFTTEGVKPENMRGREMRTMDCVDCHNRPSHRFAPTPERAVDAALQVGGLPRTLPYVRREAVAVLKQQYPDRPSAERAIRAHLEGFYVKNYAALVAARDGRIAQAVLGAERIYAHNVFPRMRLAWGAHPNNIGHTDSPGCFRCHDEEHASPDGRTIRQDCELCHNVQ